MSRLLDTAQTLALGFVVRRLLAGARRQPALIPTLSSPKNATVSVIIPARNEALRIEACLRGLQHQSCVAEIIVVDDESTDKTAVIAAQFGATVLRGSPPPSHWVGKPWALHQGITAACSNIVVVLDADTIPRPGLIPTIFSQLVHHDIISLAPRFLTSSFVEKALHSSMLAGLVYRFGAVGVDTSVTPERVYGNGQCLAFRRDWFLAEGGMELAANQMNDDIALLRALASRGARMAFLDGRDVIDVRMFSSAREAWHEWGRSLPMVDITTPAALILDLTSLWLVLVLPVLRLFFGRFTKIDLACLTLRAGMTRAFCSSYEGSNLAVYASPLFDIASVIRLTQATCNPVRSWRGRAYTPQGSGVRQTS